MADETVSQTPPVSASNPTSPPPPSSEQPPPTPPPTLQPSEQPPPAVPVSSDEAPPPVPSQEGDNSSAGEKKDYYRIAKQWADDNITEDVASDIANDLIILIRSVFYAPVDVLVELFDLIIHTVRYRFTLFVYWLIFVLIMNIFNVLCYFVLGSFDILPYIVGSILGTILMLLFLLRTVKKYGDSDNTKPTSETDEANMDDEILLNTEEEEENNANSTQPEIKNKIKINIGEEYADEEEL